MDSWAAQPGTGSRTASSTRRRSRVGNIRTSSPTRMKDSGTRIATGAAVGAMRATAARMRQRPRRALSARTGSVARRLTFGCAAACWNVQLRRVLRHHRLHRHHRHHHLRYRHHRRHHHRAQKAGASWAEASTGPQPLTFPVLQFPCPKTVPALQSVPP